GDSAGRDREDRQPATARLGRGSRRRVGGGGTALSNSTTALTERRLRWLNELSHDEAVGALLLICHSRRWAEQVAELRPYADADALYKTADQVWLGLRPEDWLEALDGHPRIGEGGGASAEASRMEQAGVSGAEADVQVAIAAGNREY